MVCFFPYRYPVVSALFIENTISSPLNCLCTFVKNQFRENIGKSHIQQRIYKELSKFDSKKTKNSIVFKFFLNFYLLYFWLCWVFIAVCGLFSDCGERGLLFVAVRGLLIAVASLVVEHGL